MSSVQEVIKIAGILSNSMNPVQGTESPVHTLDEYLETETVDTASVNQMATDAQANESDHHHDEFDAIRRLQEEFQNLQNMVKSLSSQILEITDFKVVDEAQDQDESSSLKSLTTIGTEEGNGVIQEEEPSQRRLIQLSEIAEGARVKFPEGTKMRTAGSQDPYMKSNGPIQGFFRKISGRYYMDVQSETAGTITLQLDPDPERMGEVKRVDKSGRVLPDYLPKTGDKVLFNGEEGVVTKESKVGADEDQLYSVVRFDDDPSKTKVVRNESLSRVPLAASAAS